jgi:hypothetical protein
MKKGNLTRGGMCLMFRGECVFEKWEVLYEDRREEQRPKNHKILWSLILLS